jgi:hypothetical protein
MSWRSEALAEARAVLERVARERSAITYSDLVAKIEAVPLEPDSKVLAEILDDISSATDQERGCMLSAVVIHKGDDELPGPGFFKLGRALGRDTSEKLAFHMSELARVHQAYE